MTSYSERTILLVEDEVLIAAVEQLILEKYGFKVITAESGEAAIEAVESTPSIDLILMDINLGDGIEGTKAAEIILHRHELPLIFLSSHTEREIVEKTEGITSYGYIVKDSGETVLIASIKMAFRLYDALKKEKEKEEALRQSEKNYRDIFDNALEGIFRISANGAIIHANSSFALMLGYKSPEDLSAGIKDQADNLWLDPHEHAIFNEKIAEHNSILGYETKYRRKDGECIWVSLSSRGVKNSSGEIAYYDGFIQDITERKQAADLIHKNEEKYRHLANNIPDIIYTLDSYGKVVTVNNRALDLFGYTAEEIKNRDFIDFIYPEDRETVVNSVIKTHELKRGHTAGLKFRISASNGNIHWFELNANTLFDESGNFCGENGVLRDITDRKKAEDALIKHNNSLRALNEYLMELAYVEYEEIYPFIIKKLKQIFNVRVAWIGEFNDSLMELDIKSWTLSEEESLRIIEAAGKKKDELKIKITEENYYLVMLNPTVVFRSLYEVSFGAIPEDVARAIDQILGIEWIMAVALIDRDKLIATALVMGSHTDEMPQRDELLAFGSITANVIKRKRAEETMRISEEQFRLLANNIPDIIYSLNCEGRITAINSSAFERYGYREDEVINSFFINFIYPEDRAEVIRLTYESLNSKKTHTSGVHFRIQADDGELYWFEANSKAYYDENGKFVSETGVLRDITERKKTKDALIKHTVVLNALNKYLLELAYIDYNEIFHFIAEKLKEIFSVSVVFIGEYDDTASSLILKAASSAEDILSAIIKKTGNNPFDIPIHINAETIDRLINQKTASINSIRDIPFGILPDDVSRLIEDTPGVKWFIPLSMIDRENLIASALIIGKENDEIPNYEALAAFSSITANMIKRKRAEEKMKKNDEFFKLICGAVVDYVYSVRIQPDGSFIRRFDVGNVNDLLEYQPKESSDADVWTNLIVPEDVPIFYDNIKSGFEGNSSRFEVRINSSPEELKFLQGYIIPVTDHAEKRVSMVFAAFQDITDRKKTEVQIRNLLTEKELLLKEVHHRIKNNMETIKNLLYLQADTLKGRNASTALHDAGNRVQSMMLLYDKLYRSDNFGVVSFSSYCSTLVKETVANFPNRERVQIIDSIDDFALDPKKIQPLGMIINELITNIMKHAITGTDTGIIKIFGILNDNTVCLIIHDNSGNFPENIDIENSDGFGLMLVRMLTKQLGGEINIQRENGVKVTLNFER